ncbi:MAG: alpha/beta fold hydrolase [Wenzhouxiangella sp.]|jgi:pimeloyl-ACP methyl ester carboxylesterase|nr:alpha/beta fold hydrolase [Wenzhouxiangella sp.]
MTAAGSDNTGRAPVVLVHGLWYGAVSLALMARRLGRVGFETHHFSYPTVRQSLSENARALFDFAKALQADQLHFVGHSLGGLVILRMFDEWTGLPPGRVVVLGSPVRGSAAAVKITRLKLARPFVGQARTALEHGYSHAPSGREVGVVAGTRSIGLGRLIEKLPLPHDGTIAVSETQLPGAADSIEIPQSHTGLALSGQAASIVAEFLRRGRFDHGA